MGQYSIKDLEQLSGIKAHTLRIWEKRYEIIRPQRTSTNIRYYTDADLKKILNIAMLNNHGVKISKIANLSHAEITSQIAKISNDGIVNKENYYIEQLVISMVDLDESLFNEIILEATAILGFENTVTKILYPFLSKIGVLWQTGNINPAQEHFVSHLIRQKIIAATDAIRTDNLQDQIVLLFLPENELHEIGLLFANYIARQLKLKTVYLGQSVPYDDLLSVIRTHKPDVLISYFVSMQESNIIENYLSKLSKDTNNTPHFISGTTAMNHPIKLPASVRKYSNSAELIALLKD